jgi:uncharacterized OB-fold protein
VKGLGADTRYWEALSEGRLDLPRCKACQRWIWPAPFRCGACGSWDIGWETVEPTGTIYSWARTWHPFAGAEELGLPYVTVSIALPQAGGVRLMGLLEPGEGAAIGVPVTGVVATHRVFDRAIPALRWSPVA